MISLEQAQANCRKHKEETISKKFDDVLEIISKEIERCSLDGKHRAFIYFNSSVFKNFNLSYIEMVEIREYLEEKYNFTCENSYGYMGKPLEYEFYVCW